MTSLKGHEIPSDQIKDAVNASPYYKHLNMKLVEFSEKECKMIMEMEMSHLSVYGRAHGGAIASLADSACSLALAAVIKRGEFIATQNLNVNYLMPVEKGTLTAKGRILYKGRHTAILEADIFDQLGVKIAHAHSVHVIKASRGEWEDMPCRENVNSGTHSLGDKK